MFILPSHGARNQPNGTAVAEKGKRTLVLPQVLTCSALSTTEEAQIRVGRPLRQADLDVLPARPMTRVPGPIDVRLERFSRFARADRILDAPLLDSGLPN